MRIVPAGADGSWRISIRTASTPLVLRTIGVSGRTDWVSVGPHGLAVCATTERALDATVTVVTRTSAASIEDFERMSDLHGCARPPCGIWRNRRLQKHRRCANPHRRQTAPARIILGIMRTF